MEPKADALMAVDEANRWLVRNWEAMVPLIGKITKKRQKRVLIVSRDRLANKI